MALNKIPSLTHGSSAAGAGVPGRRRIFFLRSRRKLPTVRLGGGGGGEKAPRRRFLVKILRRVRVKWEYSRLVKKIKAYYQSMLRDISDGGAGGGVGPTDEYFRRMLFVETFLAVPMMGI